MLAAVSWVVPVQSLSPEWGMGGKGEERGGVSGEEKEATVTDGYGGTEIYILKQTNYLFRTVEANKEGGNRGVAVWGRGIQSGFFGPGLWSFY